MDWRDLLLRHHDPAPSGGCLAVSRCRHHRSRLRRPSAPPLASHRSNRPVKGVIKGAYAAAIGTTLGASVMPGRIAIGDWFTVMVGLLSLAASCRWKVSSPLLMVVTALHGYVAFSILHPTWVMIQ